MTYAIREDLVWLIENAKLVGLSREWRCTHHPDTTIEQVLRPRSPWLYPMPHAGFGNVIQVLHIYCPRCNPERHCPNDAGEGIYSIQLIQVDEDLLPLEEQESLMQLFQLHRSSTPATG
ncbi:MAG: hypothetical protein ACM3TU_00070 [Bacillota bacterium]